MQTSFIIQNENDLEQVANHILSNTEHCKFSLKGEMGSGKTTLVKKFCKFLEVSDVVNSPTFSIINEYTSKFGVIYHFDFYRIKNQQEVFDLGYERYFYSSSYCFLEWPEKIPDLIIDDFIEIEILCKNSERIINIAI
ncbi:MAG: tRNA (adenosine(37)-N6)-threonylcarbamoyltransferase complex ATPase subunit type 1 TsaE [Bacteroidota bacterium]|nr:tRNA (adenosine(37)-N6)-threonylcarbamoyltransferase complex ATPase subunit type 1 TsaE [Bacteroidota bacterium]